MIALSDPLMPVAVTLTFSVTLFLRQSIRQPERANSAPSEGNRGKRSLPSERHGRQSQVSGPDNPQEQALERPHFRIQE